MSDTDKQTLANIAEAVARMNEIEKARLLGFSEGVALMAKENTCKAPLDGSSDGKSA